MTSTFSRLSVVGVVLVGLMAGPLPRAFAQDEAALAKVKDLNKKAIEAYENLDLDEAKKLLQEALALCASEGLNKHALKATTHVNMGVLFVGGLKQRDNGIKQFKRALEIDANVKVAKRLSNPEIQAAFEAAKSEPGEAPVAKEQEKPAEPAKPAPEPEKPASATAGEGKPGQVKGVFHEPLTESKGGEAIAVKAAVESGLQFDRVVLAYRPEGASDFLARDMEKDASGWYVARIPEPATGGASVAYYIEARARGGQAVASNGSSAEPHVIALGAAAVAAAGGSQANSGEDPGVSARAERPSKGGGGKFWVGVGVGGGYGYAKGNPEVSPRIIRKDNSVKPIDFAGVAPAQLMHVVPEVGYFYAPGILLSLQGRFQLVTGATKVKNDKCSNMVCEPAKGAVAVLGKVTWLSGGEAAFKPFFSLAAGGGQIRYLVNLKNVPLMDCGDSGDQACLDTVAGGVVLLGPSAGFAYGLTKDAFFTAAVNALAGFPNTALNLDVNVGVAFKM
jgi:hypothetical protein